jgi:pimeloyl-ACP methyl ester carboxylesterase
MDFTLAHPERVDALVLAASALSGYREWNGNLREMWEKVEAAVKQGDFKRAQDMEFAAWVHYGIYPESDAKIRRLAEENLKIYEVDPELETSDDHPAIDRLSEVNIPTLVIVAENDQPDIEKIAGRLANGIRNSTLVRISGTDHLVNMRNPIDFDRVVLGFLEKINR